jgi:DNA-binding beta-propeller fold protein YncE
VLPLLLCLLSLSCGRKFDLPTRTPGEAPTETSYLRIGDPWPGGRGYILDNPRDVILGFDGFVYILDASGVRKFNTSGYPRTEFSISALDDPRAIAQAPDRNLYVANNADKSVRWYDNRTGEFLGAFTDTLIGSITGLAVDSIPYIYLSDGERNLVTKRDSTGAVIETLATFGEGAAYVSDPRGLAIQTGGGLALASTGHNWVEILSRQVPAVNLLHLGGSTHDGGDTPGLFRRPVDVSLDDTGGIFAADSENRRIQKFNVADGQFVTAFGVSDTASRFRPLGVAASPDGRYVFVCYQDEGGGQDRLEKYERASLQQE